MSFLWLLYLTHVAVFHSLFSETGRKYQYHSHNNTISMVRCWNKNGQTYLKFKKLKNGKLL